MALFGKSESELKQFASELEKRQIGLDNRESAVRSAQSSAEHDKKLLEDARTRLESEREAFRDEAKNLHDDIASEASRLEKRRIELTQMEAAAKAGFVEKQREAFKEVIERRMAALDARQQDLDGLEQHLAARLKELHATEAELATRELSVTEREQKADAGFADKARALADEAARQQQANQAEADRLRMQAHAIAEERRRMEEVKAQLVQREQAIIEAEQKRDAGFADERAALNTELRTRRAEMEAELAEAREKAFSDLEADIAKRKRARLEEISEEAKTQSECVRAEISEERETWSKQEEAARKQLEAERTEIARQKGAISSLQSELEGRKSELESNERTLERKEQRLERLWEKRNDDLESQLEARLEEERGSLEAERRTYKEENARLRESLRIQTEIIGVFEQLKRQLGDNDPAEIIRELNSKTDENKRLLEELATRPTEEMREKCQEMEAESQRQKARIEELQEQISTDADTIAKSAELRRKNSELDADNKSLAQRASRFEGAANEAQAELSRLRAAYERPQEKEARYKEIEMPYVNAEKIVPPVKKDDIDEIDWLAGIGDACTKYGIKFNPRILKAFHTAVKTAEWSPLTILAGVSGTGKSELPKLYSHFGGLLFEPLSVQPNWDSQESMLGFFNSIDNKFDAQPILRFLAQSQKKWIMKNDDQEGYPGLLDCVCMVLLDEMNLAHPELYFAEFLSKMELRRSYKGDDVPSLSVKIGAGLPEYKLPLGRNVLWTGTMNQDETTKSLSDKVLDRSIIIHFPRPTTLERRQQLIPLDDKNRGPLLHCATWQSWWSRGGDFTEEQVKQFKEFIEKMNTALAVVGRAIGHRVWQSVEYYLANHPDVRAAQKADDKDAITKALHIAFEDQLVQKVMPKLRGIDTRGKSKTECLDKILAQINTGIGGTPFNLAEDFNLACELGYGQFIWQSANYLTDDPVSSKVEVLTTDEEQADNRQTKRPEQ